MRSEQNEVISPSFPIFMTADIVDFPAPMVIFYIKQTPELPFT